jgi:DNA polymerase III delta subunit
MEVDKLATYVGARKRINRDDVAAMVDAGRIREIWDALNAATTGRGEDALITLGKLFAAKEAPQKMIAAMTSSLLKTHHAGVLRRAKVEAREACREAGIPPFAAETTLKQHAHLGPSRVDKLPEMLLRCDLGMKGASQLAPEAVLERLAVELSRPRRD